MSRHRTIQGNRRGAEAAEESLAKQSLVDTPIAAASSVRQQFPLCVLRGLCASAVALLGGE